MSIKGGRATIGMQRPSSDPHIETFDDGDLAGLTQEVLPVIERARAKWEGEPRHQTHESPLPRPDVSPGVHMVRRKPPPPRVGGADLQQPDPLGLFLGPNLGRRGMLDPSTQGKDTMIRGSVSSPWAGHVCGPFCVSAQRRVHVCRPFLTPITWP